jgi:prepilin-type N-terminal cleavage/methylation domain-containing protein
MSRFRHAGFTLLEIAIVLAILSVMLAAAATTLVRQLEGQRYANAERELASIRDALVGYAMTHKRLPRPATSALDGLERTSDCASESECTGLIPWTTLGIGRLDPWGKHYRYSVTRELANSTMTIQIGSAGRKEVFSSSRSTGSTGDVASAVAAVVWSHGARNFGHSETGQVLANTSVTNLDEQANTSATFPTGGAGQRFVARQPTDFIGYRDRAGHVVGEFDDVVSWLSMPVLIARLVAAGRIAAADHAGVARGSSTRNTTV